MPDAIDQFLGFKKEIVSDAVGLMLVILVAVGLRTRLCSVILIVWLGLAPHLTVYTGTSNILLFHGNIYRGYIN